MRVELRCWSGYGAFFTRLDTYRVFFHTSTCKSVSSPHDARTQKVLSKGSNFDNVFLVDEGRAL